MRRLVSLQQLYDEAEENGMDPATIMVDREDIAEIDGDTLDTLQNPEENPEED
ncbi:hypothetical protein ACFLYC_00540 [Chloroflexota bacterium]